MCTFQGVCYEMTNEFETKSHPHQSETEKQGFVNGFIAMYQQHTTQNFVIHSLFIFRMKLLCSLTELGVQFKHDRLVV